MSLREVKLAQDYKAQHQAKSRYQETSDVVLSLSLFLAVTGPT